MTALPRNTILLGDAVAQLRTLPPSSVDCIITSPPYYQLRDYGVDGQLGLEATVDDWVSGLLRVCRELGRVLKPTGSLWLNVADSYSTHLRFGAPPKGQLLAPERLLLALAQDGWIVRNKVVWAKPNPMPSSVADRLNTTHEYIYFLVRSRKYYFDLDAIREPHRSAPRRRVRQFGNPPRGALTGNNGSSMREVWEPGHPLGKNPGDVWQVSTRGFRGAHFATFPETLIEKPLLASCPERICTECEEAWRREVTATRVDRSGDSPTERDQFVNRYPNRWEVVREIGDFIRCGCTAPTRPGVVLDPFFGSGTVGVVAERLGRDWLGIELNPVYVSLAWGRIREGRDGRKAEQTTGQADSVVNTEGPVTAVKSPTLEESS